MPNQTEASLTRNWAILIALILQIRGALGAVVTLRAGRRNPLCHLLRVAEGLARRWLILKAGCVGCKTACKTASAPPSSSGGEKRGLLRLIEPDPVLRPDDYSDQPYEAARLPGSDQAGLSDACAGITRRSEALLDVMRRPHYHTARMARWLKRAAKRARKAFVRRHPLRVGRPPGARRRERSCEVQAALWWLDKLARDSLLPGWVP